MNNVANIKTINKFNFEEINKKCFALANEQLKVHKSHYYKSYKIKLLQHINGTFFAKCLYFTNENGIGVYFVFKNIGEISNKTNWEFCEHKPWNYSKNDSIVNHINSICNKNDYIKIRIES